MITRDLVRHAKPDPDLFLAAAAELGVNPRYAMVVGDSVWDLLAARRPGRSGRAAVRRVRPGGTRAGRAYRVYADRPRCSGASTNSASAPTRVRTASLAPRSSRSTPPSGNRERAIALLRVPQESRQECSAARLEVEYLGNRSRGAAEDRGARGSSGGELPCPRCVGSLLACMVSREPASAAVRSGRGQAANVPLLAVTAWVPPGGDMRSDDIPPLPAQDLARGGLGAAVGRVRDGLGGRARRPAGRDAGRPRTPARCWSRSPASRTTCLSSARAGGAGWAG